MKKGGVIMLQQKHGCRWLSTVLVFLCCMVLLISVAGNVQATQVEDIEPIWQVQGDPGLDSSRMPGEIDGPDYADTLEEAAQELREALKDRDTYAVLYVKTNAYSADTLGEIIGEILDLAVAHTGDPTEGDYIAHQYSGCRARLSGGVLGGVYYLKLEYFVDYFTTEDQEEELDVAVEELLEELDLENATDYQKVKGVYDWLCQNVTYDYTHMNDEDYLLCHSAYAAIIDRTAVCQGYATAMYRLLLELDVDVRYVGGIGNGGSHGWNIVKLGTKYYNLDATWDATRTQFGVSYAYFLKNDADFDDHWRDDNAYPFVNTEDYPMAEASYDENGFAVIFRDENGQQLSQTVYHYGDAIVAPEAPVNAADQTYTYTFSGWDAEVGMCTGDQTFTAVYEKEYIDYLVVFQYEDGTLISQNTYHYGDEVNVPEQVSPPAGQEGLVHDGWDSPITNCFGNKVYTAVFGSAAVKGDFDGDDVVTNSDVIYFLWHTLFPENYPLSQDADFTHDGQVTNQDVIFLLWHTLFPDSYPLT